MWILSMVIVITMVVIGVQQVVSWCKRKRYDKKIRIRQANRQQQIDKIKEQRAYVRYV
jgi:heme exporter protein D